MAADLKSVLKSQLWNLQELVLHLEDRGTLGWEEYQYCQAKLHEVLEQLKRVERLAKSGNREG
jgi:hypothetical protein